jgi:hypothetical protein
MGPASNNGHLSAITVTLYKGFQCLLIDRKVPGGGSLRETRSLATIVVSTVVDLISQFLILYHKDVCCFPESESEVVLLDWSKNKESLAFCQVCRVSLSNKLEDITVYNTINR